MNIASRLPDSWRTVYYNFETVGNRGVKEVKKQNIFLNTKIHFEVFSIH